MAGGTGGHIFPGIAVADELRARGVPVVWLGGEVGLEGRLVPQAGIPLEKLAFSGVRGKNIATLLMAPLRLLRAVLAARQILQKTSPRSVLSMGGYAAAPGGIAAWLARFPLIVHEQNRVPGFTNRLLAQFARRLLAGFSDAFPPGRAEWVGNPVRADIAAMSPPNDRLAARSGAPRLLVIGGSQGAQILNTRVPAALAMMPASLRYDVRHQCGAKHVDSARAAYAAAGVSVSVEPFIDDMVAAYAWADLVVCRAGALTIAELAAAGLASVLVPFAAAVDDHQTRNAEALVGVGAARLLPENVASIDRLSSLLTELGNDRAQLLAMATAARTLAKPEATRRIADCCLEFAA